MTSGYWAAPRLSSEADPFKVNVVIPPFVADSVCAQTDPELFFPEKGGSSRLAKQICSGCPAREACAEWALDTGERFGVWGALSPRERRKIVLAREKAAA